MVSLGILDHIAKVLLDHVGGKIPLCPIQGLFFRHGDQVTATRPRVLTSALTETGHCSPFASDKISATPFGSIERGFPPSEIGLGLCPSSDIAVETDLNGIFRAVPFSVNDLLHGVLLV